jgi:hypothetical protein
MAANPFEPPKMKNGRIALVLMIAFALVAVPLGS